MAQKLWEKNVQVNAEIDRFTVGRDREMDLYLAKHDVLGSMAHITMLESIGLLEADELSALLEELKNIYASAEAGEFVIEDGIEDVHSQVELMLTRKLGDVGKKIHSGRSRNDQVLVDLKLFTRAQLKEIAEADFDIRMHVDKRYFSDEDWAAITEIFEIARPIMLMRCCKKANVAYFVFSKKSQTNTSVTLYYFPDPTDELVDFYDGDFTVKYYPIDDNWWILVEDSDKPLRYASSTRMLTASLMVSARPEDTVSRIARKLEGFVYSALTRHGP